MCSRLDICSERSWKATIIMRVHLQRRITNARMAESTVHSRVERCDCRWVGSIFIRILIELNCEMERTLPTNVKRVIVDAWVIDERIIFVPIHFFFYKMFPR